MYIVIEGIDTAGKSTQIELLRQKLPQAVFTKEPGGTSIGIDIREMILHKGLHSKVAEMYLFLADRAEHYENIIKPNINNIIISDRSLISGISYAMTNSNFDIDFLLLTNKIAMQNKMPDHVFVLQLSKNELEKRLSSKSNDKIEARGSEYLLKIQANMIDVTQKLNIAHTIIDASNEINFINNLILQKIIV